MAGQTDRQTHTIVCVYKYQISERLPSLPFNAQLGEESMHAIFTWINSYSTSNFHIACSFWCVWLNVTALAERFGREHFYMHAYIPLHTSVSSIILRV